MSDGVRFPRPPNINSIKTVKEEWKPENSGLDENAPRNALKLHGNVVVLLHAYKRIAVRPEVLEKKNANGYYAAEGMQFIEEVTRS